MKQDYQPRHLFIMIFVATILVAGRALGAGYGNLPLSFEPNQGQTDPQAKFLARGPGYNLFLKPTEAILSLRGNALRSRLVGANENAAMTGLQTLPGKVNYFHGKSAHTDIPTFARVSAREVYPGIDLIHYGNDGQLEYDFVVAPGADPAHIRMAIDGADSLKLGETGELVIKFGKGEVRWHKPVIYQIVDAERREVAGRFVLLDKQTVGFEIGAYDRSRALVIDPSLVYSTFVKPTTFAGGDGLQNHGLAIRADADGNVYVAGVTESASFPASPGAYDTTRPGGEDAFVAKLNPTGSAVVFATYLGGTGNEILDQTSCGVAFDSAHNVYVTGSTISTNFPVTGSAFQTTLRYNGISYSADAFVTKLNPTGSALIYSTYLGGTGDDKGTAIAVDADGQAYVCGKEFSGNDFPTTPGAFVTNALNYTGFVTKLSADGSSLVYSTLLAVNATSTANAIAVDAAGNAYVTGDCYGCSLFPTTPGAFQTTPGGSDAFVLKLNSTGSALVYGTFLGGKDGEEGRALALDADGNAYITGTTYSTNFPTTVGAFQPNTHVTLPINQEGYVTKLNPTGSALVWSTYLGGTGGDVPEGIAVDGAGNAYIAGSTGSTNFPVTAGAYQSTFGLGYGSGFVTKLGAAGGLAYSSYLHGTNANSIVVTVAIATDTNGNAYVTGSAGLDLPTTPGAFQGNAGVVGGPYVVKFSLADAVAPTPPAAPTKLRAISQSASVVYLTWKDNSNNEAKFRIQSALADTGPWTTLANVGANVVTYYDTNVVAGTTYFYRVFAINPYGKSAKSNVASSTPQTTTSAPAAPTDLVATAISSTQVDLSWLDNANNECGFKILRGQNAGGPFPIIATTGADITTFSDKTATGGTTWYYKVRAINPSGNSPPSNVANATTPP